MITRTNKKTVQELLDNTWKSYPPEFYITLHWKNLPRQLETVIKDTQFFNNIFRMRFEGCNTPKYSLNRWLSIKGHFEQQS